MLSNIFKIQLSLFIIACLSPKFEARNPTLIISIDGLRQSSLDDYLNANVFSFMRKEFKDVGVKADYMTTTFPSNKFTNYFSMSSGINSRVLTFNRNRNIYLFNFVMV
jgi:predicted AlkP superfamily pyrophosphatase or phosphodiesterase